MPISAARIACSPRAIWFWPASCVATPKISLRRLVRRPALVHATPTHIDLCFDARWVELEVRLAGLDLDPGWVPWLGRVVTFHYDYEGRP